MSRVTARRTPLSQRATRADAEIARRRAAPFARDADNETLLTQVNIVPAVDPDVAKQQYERKGSKHALSATSHEPTLATKNVPSVDEEQAGTQAQEACLPLGPLGAQPAAEPLFEIGAVTSELTDDANSRKHAYLELLDDNGNVVKEDCMPSSPRDQISASDKRNGERKVIAPGAPVPNGPAQSVTSAQLDWLSAQLASVSALPQPRAAKRARPVDESTTAAESHPTKTARRGNVLRSVRVELAGPTGVTYEEWTHADAYGAALPLQNHKNDKTNAPPSWIKATHASSSRTDPWKGGPVRTASGMLLHAGGSAKVSDAAEKSEFRPESPTFEEDK